MGARPAGRFTFDGSDQVEARTAEVVREVARRVERAIDPRDLEALVLIGGYGRGEGGVEVVDGVERPHNNLDFLLVSRRGDGAAMRARLGESLAEVARQHGIGVDLGVVSASMLRRSPCRIMWYDMRFGHKTVLGDEAFVPSLQRFTVDRILPSDARDLLTNRGTLLVINDLLLARGALPEQDRKLVVKHVVKAIIGYGDAWLCFAGDYHWSYVEKRARMKARRDVDEAFRALYDEALAFRFRPAYDTWLARDLAPWVAGVKRQLSVVHRRVEERRLGRSFSRWDDYLALALPHELWDGWRSPRALAGKAKNLLHPVWRVHGLDLRARAGLAVAGRRGSLPLVFPAVAYEDVGPLLRERAAEILEARDASREALARAYLRRWGIVGDTNFGAVLARHQIDLSEDRPR